MSQSREIPRITIDSLPPDVLAQILRTDNKAQCRAHLAVCIAFAKAMLCSDLAPEMTLDVNNLRPGLVRILRWAAECQGSFRPRLRLQRQGTGSASMKLMCLMLQQAEVTLEWTHVVICKNLLLDAPGGLAALLPNMQELQLINCLIDPDSMPLTGCTRLRDLVLSSNVPRTKVAPGWLTQLGQLAGLPSLASLEFHTLHFPTAFLPALSEQLTRLRLINDRRSPFKEQQVDLGHVAELTSLRHLELGRCTLQQLAKLSTLPHLDTLHLGNQAGDPDELINTLLGFPHLTSVLLQELSGLEKSFADQPFGWQELALGSATPRMLVRLPLHSIKTLRLGCLKVHLPIDLHDPNGTPEVADLQAAVLNLRQGPQPVRLLSHRVDAFKLSAGNPAGVLDISFMNEHEWMDLDDHNVLPSPAARSSLQAIAPLVPDGVAILEVSCVKVDAALLVALRQVVPDSVGSIILQSCLVDPSCWAELARSFPDLKFLRIDPTGEVSPMEVMAYYCAAGQRQRQADGTLHAAHVSVYPCGNESDDDYYILNKQLGFLGFKARVKIESTWRVGQHG